MKIFEKLITPKYTSKVNKINLEQEQKLKYLSRWITSDGRSITEEKNMIG